MEKDKVIKMELNALCEYYRLYPEDHPILIGGAAASLWLTQKYSDLEIHDYDIHVFDPSIPRNKKDTSIERSYGYRMIIKKWLALLPRYKVKNDLVTEIITLVAPTSEGKDIDIFINQWDNDGSQDTEILNGTRISDGTKVQIPVLKFDVVLKMHETGVPEFLRSVQYCEENRHPDLEYERGKYERMKKRLELFKTL